MDFRAVTAVTTSGREPRDRRISPSLRLLAAAILCGLGLAASGVTLVRAADDAGIFRVLRSDYLNRVAASMRLRERERPRPVALPIDTARRPVVATPVEAPRRMVARKARVAFAAANTRIAARRTVCVRMCDGYVFPVGTLQRAADLPLHATACKASCPGTETRLYTLAPGQRLDDAAKARSVVDGSPYRGLKTAFLFRKERVANCSCQGPDNIASRLPILMDPTLRTGDVVVDPRGRAKAYAGSGRVPHSPRAFADYRGSPALTRTARAQVDRLVGTSQREAAARAFERSLRTREASLREVSAPAGSGAGVRAYQVSGSAGTLDASGARIIVIR